MIRIVYLFFLVVFAQKGYAQETSVCSKEQAISILQNSEFINIHRSFDEDKPVSVEKFIIEIDKIVPLDEETRQVLSEQLLAMVQTEQQYVVNNSLIFWSITTQPFIGPSALDILKDNFSALEYEKLSAGLLSGWLTAIEAYDFLRMVWKEEFEKEIGESVTLTFPGSNDGIDFLYDYFDI